MASLEEVRDDKDLGPKLPEFTVFTQSGNPFTNQQLQAFKKVKDSQK